MPPWIPVVAFVVVVEIVREYSRTTTGIDNTPPISVVANILRLWWTVRQVPNAYVVNGYRSPAVNAAVRDNQGNPGQGDSLHLVGLAADLIPTNGQTMDGLEAAARQLQFSAVLNEGDHVHVQLAR